MIMFLAVAIVVGCGPLAPAPELAAVEPARGWQGESTAVVIEGDHLLPAVTLGTETPVGGEWEVWLESAGGELYLEGTELLDYRHLAAQVPAGLEAGEYPLWVRTPTGQEARLDSGFRVAATKADRLEVTITDAAYDLGEYATLTVRVLDPNGDVLAAELEVEVEATSPIDAAGVEFAADQLLGQAPLAAGVGIQGALDPDGTTKLLVRSTAADDVTFAVRAVDDDGLTAGEVLVSWNTGELANIEVTFPFSPFRVRAGEPFPVHLVLLDQYGNALPDSAARVSISDATECSSFRTVEDLVGEADVELTLSAACTDRLLIFNSNVEVESEPFEIVAAEMSGYQVTVAPFTDVSAGIQPVIVAVDAVDEFGNVVPDFAGAVDLSDTLGGLDAERTTCTDLTDGQGLCTTYLLRAGSDVLQVTDELLRVGISNPVEVVPDEPAGVVVSLAVRETIAGNEAGAVVALTDNWGNFVDFDPGGADPVEFTDSSESVSCAWSGAVGDGRQGFLCTFTRAWVGSEVHAALPRLALQGTAPDTITIFNAELAEVALTTPATAVAGRPFTLSLAGFDEFGNAYERQTNPDLALEDSTGTLTLGTVTLDAAGEASLSEALTVAGPARLWASQFGVVLGVSAVIDVSAAEMNGFAVEAPAWVGVGEVAEVAITAVDSYGNTVATYGGGPTVSVTGEACGGESVSALAGGEVTVDLDCTSVQLDARVAVADGTYAGTSSVLDIVDFDCASPPTPHLEVDGEVAPVLCLASGEASAVVDSSGSAAGGAALTVFAFEDNEGTRDRGTSGTSDYTWVGAGPRQVDALVVDAQGCADTETTWVWIGEDDGEPTGPVTVTPSASTVASGGSVSVEVTARDCTGDVAAGQELFVRANLGTVAGSSTGEGLTVTLDSVGEGSTVWSFPGGYAAVATFYAGSSSSGAYGTGLVAVTQDSARPHVTAVDPFGTTVGTISAITVEFDEGILESTVSAIQLTGPSGAIAVTAVLNDDTVTLTPTTPVDASSGAFTLTIPSSVRDSAGNRLDGDWSGAATGFVSTFGAVADTLPTMGGCAIDLDAFHPDGDDGSAAEADLVTFTPVASASPTWWRLTVVDPAGETVRTTRISGALGSLTWEGVGDDGRVVEGGTYAVTVAAIDANENVTTACTDSITVEHRLELP
ncbi:hypothetical protein LBMAG42_30720 [Deltaproteobacteria bacterium]|nr:hypothetical protein LBMAG42_30720 [Deltaproteobacteria bacterium]